MGHCVIKSVQKHFLRNIRILSAWCVEVIFETRGVNKWETELCDTVRQLFKVWGDVCHICVCKLFGSDLTYRLPVFGPMHLEQLFKQSRTTSRSWNNLLINDSRCLSHIPRLLGYRSYQQLALIERLAFFQRAPFWKRVKVEYNISGVVNRHWCD